MGPQGPKWELQETQNGYWIRCSRFFLGHVSLFARSTFEKLISVFFFEVDTLLNLRPSTSPNWGEIPRWPQPSAPSPKSEKWKKDFSYMEIGRAHV